MTSRRSIVTLLLVSLSTLIGCKYVGLKKTPIDPALAQQLSQLVYPKDAPLGDDLDMLVIHNGEAIQLINRTPMIYRDVHLWLNRQYVARIDQVRIGTGNHYDLAGFFNHYAEPFPVAAPLRPEIARRVLAAELFDPATGKRHRLVVRSAHN